MDVAAGILFVVAAVAELTLWVAPKRGRLAPTVSGFV